MKSRFFALCVAVVFCLVSTIADGQYIRTIAGQPNVYGFTGDGGAATNAHLAWPRSITSDKFGNLFLIDDSRVRKIDTNGVITTVVGGGSSYGDGGPATNASLNAPSNIALDSFGSIYVSDQYDNTIRRISPSGIISTICGTGVAGFGGDGGPATNARLNHPFGIAVDRFRNVYVTDQDNNTVRKIDTNGTITKIVGRGFSYPSFRGDGGQATAADIYFPQGISVDYNRNIYLCDVGNHRIRKIDSLGIISTYAGYDGGDSISVYAGNGGPATGAILGAPYNAKIDDHGNLFIADEAYNMVRKVDSNGIISIIAGPGFYIRSGPRYGENGPATHAYLTPGDVAIGKHGSLFVADLAAQTVRLIDTCHAPNTLPINGPSELCVGASFHYSDSTHGGTWYTDDTISAAVSSLGVLSGIAGGVSYLFYNASNRCGIEPNLKQIDINPYAGSILNPPSPFCLGDTRRLLASYSGGTWSSSDTTIAIVDGSGLVYSRSIGSVIISYSVWSRCGIGVITDTFTILSADTASHITGISSICRGSVSTIFSTLSGGTWSLTDTSLASIDTSGVVHARHVGFDTIHYSITGACGVRISSHPLVVDSPILVARIVGPTFTCAGASSVFSDSLAGAIWSVNDTNIAQISSSGILRGLSAGIVIISYGATNACGSHLTTDSITVYPLVNAGSITSAASVCEHSAVTLVDTGSSASGGWRSSRTSIATVNTAGLLTGVASGTTVVSYTVTNPCYSATTTDTITVRPLPHAGAISGASSVCAGSNISLTDTASGGSWNSSNTSLATVSASGVVHAIAAGSVVISYSNTNSCGTAVATHSVTVNPLAVAGTISGTTSICQDSTTHLVDTTGSGTGVWSSSTTGVATVTASGIVRGVAGGTSVVSYTVTNPCGSAVAITTVTVQPRPTVSAISGATPVCPGATATLTDATSGGVWSSSDTTIARIASSGVVHAISGGIATITYTVSNSCGSTSVLAYFSVNPTPEAGVITGASTLCATDTTTLADTVAGGSWNSTNTGIATVNASGLVTGVAAGVDTVVYTVVWGCGPATTAHIININPAPNAGAIAGTDSLCPGDTTTLYNTVAGGSWSSSACTGIASISGSGLVTALTPGTCNLSYSVTNSCGTANSVYPFLVRAYSACPTGIEAVTATEEGILVYPNPSGGEFTIELLSALEETGTVTITNVTGQVIVSMEVKSNKAKNVYLQQASGVYFVQVRTPRSIFTQKLLLH